MVIYYVWFNQNNMKNNQKGFANVVLIGAIVVVLAIGGYFIIKNKNKSTNPIVSPINNIEDKMEIKIYFNDSNSSDPCNETYEVTRTIPKTLAVADASLKILFSENLTELKNNYLGVSIKDSVAVVNFKRPALDYLNNTACIQMSFKIPIEKTLLQYPTIKEVDYSIDGKVFTEFDA